MQHKPVAYKAKYFHFTKKKKIQCSVVSALNVIAVGSLSVVVVGHMRFVFIGHTKKKNTLYCDLIPLQNVFTILCVLHILYCI